MMEKVSDMQTSGVQWMMMIKLEAGRRQYDAAEKK